MVVGRCVDSGQIVILVKWVRVPSSTPIFQEVFMKYILTRGMVDEFPEYHSMIRDYISEMRENGFYTVDRDVDFYHNCTIFVIGDTNDNPMSFIMVAPFPLKPNETFSLKHFKGNVLVMGAYTKPEYRNKGLYTLVYSYMFKYFKERGKEYKRLLSGFNNQNTISKHIQLKKHNRMLFQEGSKFSRTYTWFNPTWRESMIDLYYIIRNAFGFSENYDSEYYEKMFKKGKNN